MTPADDTTTPPPVDTSPPPPDTNPTQNLMLRGGRGNDHLTGGDGNDHLYGARGNDALMGQSGNDVLRGDSGRDILMGGQGNDAINGNAGRDYLLLDGTMQDYSFVITERGTTITNSTGEVDTVKNVEVFHFSDRTNYLVGKNALVQTTNPNINKFLADSGVDQSYLGPVSTTETRQAPVQSANPALTSPSASNPTDADSVLAHLKQQVHDAFVLNGGHPSDAADDLAALLHFTHHE